MSRRWVLVLALALSVLGTGRVHADRVDRLIQQLETSSDYKVRLSAALALSKLRQKRTVEALRKALSDEDKTVRGVAAASLGKIISARTPPSIRESVLASLQATASRDPNAFVSKQAQKAFDKISSYSQGGALVAGGTYVHIGPMAATTDSSVTMRALMVATTKKTFEKTAGGMTLGGFGGSEPSARQLESERIRAFHVDGTLNSLSVRSRGGTATVSCQISMLIATFPDKSMFGFLKGGAQVEAGSSSRDIAYAQEDCVAAVVEDLITRKIIPTIEMRSP